ncbi:SGNH/GDSL hydrolase family protein [Rhodohalobacter sp. 614A]|uniref:SGNH/GDSL hydrolase family protein n=1 Tax=Rhodohalobacter sp. 614A TaxID=2908649 RepID=UPI001F2D601E|nr:SGNH/GDSL hydrolase family protein [Rhodohalobacter sp. 614A]
MREFIKNVLLVSIPSLIILIIMLEIILAFFMPLPSRPETIYDEQTNILKFNPESGSGTYTKGKFFQLRADWSINNEGWNSPIDYQPDSGKNLIAVIGDSYVEALQVDITKSYPNLLNEMLPDDQEVYAFGKSLYPLTQYLHVSRYVVEKYNPSTLVFTIVHNDFNESITGGTDDPRFRSLMTVTVNPDSTIIENDPVFTNFLDEKLNPGFVRSIIQKSRVQRYVRHYEYLGINLQRMFANMTESLSADEEEAEKEAPNFEANINPEEVFEMREQIELAVDYTIGKIREENPNKRIIFVMDAPREVIYDGNDVSTSGAYWLNDLMRETTEKYNMDFLNLAPWMQADYREHQTKFNSEVDSHWNEYGHQFVAETLYNYLTSEN